ncbi:MAG: hypothetical protein ABIR67_10340 [Gaiellaceae bacterium]
MLPQEASVESREPLIYLLNAKAPSSHDSPAAERSVGDPAWAAAPAGPSSGRAPTRVAEGDAGTTRPEVPPARPISRRARDGNPPVEPADVPVTPDDKDESDDKSDRPDGAEEDEEDEEDEDD